MITGQTVKNTYNGDGVTRDFTITFEFTDSSQVKFKVNGQEVETNYALNSVSKILTYPTVASELDPLTSADEIEIYRDTEITQDIEFNNGGPLNSDMIEDGLDKLTMISQELLRVARESSGLVAGKGIKISDGVVSLKGATVMPNGTDIDTLKEEGVYFVPNPTSTLGMPKASNYPTINGGYAIISVMTPPMSSIGTYFVYQEMVLWTTHFGMYSIDAPEVFTRDLTDYTYTHDNGFEWQKLTNSLTLIYTTETTINYQDYRNCRVIVNGTYESVLPTGGITSLTINGFYAMHNSHKTEIIFKAGVGFNLNSNVSHYALIGETSFTEGKCYIITVSGNVLRVEEIVSV